MCLGAVRPFAGRRAMRASRGDISGGADIQSAGVAKQPVRQRGGAVPRAIAAALEEKDPEAGAEAADLLAGGRGGEACGGGRAAPPPLVQIAAVPQALDDLGSGLSKVSWLAPSPRPSRAPGAPVVLERYGEVVRGEIESPSS